MEPPKAFLQFSTMNQEEEEKNEKEEEEKERKKKERRRGMLPPSSMSPRRDTIPLEHSISLFDTFPGWLVTTYK